MCRRKSLWTGLFGDLVGLEVEIASSVDSTMEGVVVAVGALGDRFHAAARAGFCAGGTGVEFDNVADIWEFTVGAEVFFFGGFG